MRRQSRRRRRMAGRVLWEELQSRDAGRRRGGRRGGATDERRAWLQGAVATREGRALQGDNRNNQREDWSSSPKSEPTRADRAIGGRRETKRKETALGRPHGRRRSPDVDLADLATWVRRRTALPADQKPPPPAPSPMNNTSGGQPERVAAAWQSNDLRRKQLGQEKLERLSQLMQELGIKMDLKEERAAGAAMDRKLQEIADRRQRILDEALEMESLKEASLTSNKNSAAYQADLDTYEDASDFPTISQDRGRRRDSLSEATSRVESCSAGVEQYRTLTDQLREIQMHTKQVLHEKEEALAMLAEECEAVCHETVCTREVAAEMGNDLLRVHADCESLSEERSRLEGKLRAVEEEKLKVLLTLVAARDLVVKLKVDNEGLEQELQASVSEKLSLRNAMGILQSDLDCTCARLAEQEDEVVRLEMALSEAHAANHAEQYELQQRVSNAVEVQEELHMSQVKCANLVRELELVRARNDELDRQVTQLRMTVLKMKRVAHQPLPSDHCLVDGERVESPLLGHHPHHHLGRHHHRLFGSPLHRHSPNRELFPDDDED